MRILLFLFCAGFLFPAEPGEEAPAFVLPSLDSSYVYSSKVFSGEDWVLLDFYATYCVSCNEELPLIERLAEEYAGKKVKCLLIATDQGGAPVVKPFLEKRPTSKQLLVLIDRYLVMAKKYNVESTPVMILVNPQGKIVFRQNGASGTLITDLKKLLPPLNS